MRYSDKEFLDQPVGKVLAVSSSEEDPWQSVQALSAHQKQPLQYQQKSFHADVPRFVVVVHDAAAVPQERANEAFHAIQRQIGSARCRLLVINSTAAPQPRNDIWTPTGPRYRMAQYACGDMKLPPQSAECKILGGYITNSDEKALSQFATDLITKSVLPFLQSRIDELSKQVRIIRKFVCFVACLFVFFSTISPSSCSFASLLHNTC
jgi:ER-Golgi trafficking TRAPP I complex 85 kDa subunit